MFSENEIKKGMRLAIWEGVFAIAHITLTTQAFLTGFALLLGANDLQIGIIAAIPMLTQTLQIFSVHVIEKSGQRKWITALGSVIGRFAWLPLAFIPFFAHSSEEKVLLFMLIYLVSSSALSFSGAAWISWMADLVPAKIRGRYFGRRNMVLGMVTMVVSISAGRLLDYYKVQGNLAHGYLFVELLAVVCALFAFCCLIRQPEPPYFRTPAYNYQQLLVKPFKTRHFRKLMFFYLFWTFAFGSASSFFPVYLLKTLNWSFSNLALLSIGSSAMTLITQPLWGRFIDRFGHKPVIKTTVVGMTVLPVFYFISTPIHSWPIWLDLIFTGVCWSGFNLVMFNLVIYSLPEHGKTSFIAVQSALVGMTNFIAMISGGLLAQLLVPLQINFAGLTIINYHVLFALTFVLRAMAFAFIKKLDEPEAKSVGVMIWSIFNSLNRYLGLGRSFWLLTNNLRRNLEQIERRFFVIVKNIKSVFAFLYQGIFFR